MKTHRSQVIYISEFICVFIVLILERSSGMSYGHRPWLQAENCTLKEQIVGLLKSHNSQLYVRCEESFFTLSCYLTILYFFDPSFISDKKEGFGQFFLRQDLNNTVVQDIGNHHQEPVNVYFCRKMSDCPYFTKEICNSFQKHFSINLSLFSTRT